MFEKQINSNNLSTTVGKSRILTEHFNNNLDSYVLKNRKGMSATIINYGAAIANLEVPDRDGKTADVILGHDNLPDFVGGRFYLGATIGRYANRIAGGRFSLDGKEFQVTANRTGNLLHGGSIGFDKKFWDVKIIESAEEPTLELSLISPDGEEGFPGTMEVKVIYTLTDNNELKLEYEATTDKTTVINLTNHSYFNLTGSPANMILDHILMINADKFTPTDSQSIPTGEIQNASGTPLDFRKPSKIGERIGNDYKQLKFARGYDHNWVLNNYDGKVRRAATLYDTSTGRFMELLTDQPGLQFYSGNYLDGTLKSKSGHCYQSRSGLCLECQHFPNSPNEKKFPSVMLLPEQVYRQITIYKFSVH